MMQTGTLEPNELIDAKLSESNFSEIYVYIDLKNVLTSLFVEDVVNQIISNSQTMTNVDSSIFQSILYSISVWKSYAKTKNLKLKIFISTDIGKTCYHASIHKGYKASRAIINTSSPINGEEIKSIRDRNFNISELICNRIPNVYFFCMKYLESDFVPYYLINRKFNNDNILHIICSSDKDLYQALMKPNVIQTYKLKGVSTLLSKNSILQKYIKFRKLSENSKLDKIQKIAKIDPQYITMMMALCGDVSDDVPGIKGIGPVKALEMLAQTDIVNKLVGSIENVETRILKGEKVLLEDQIGLRNLPDLWQIAVRNNDLVTMAYKLISFESLCRWLEKKDNTEKISYLDYMDDVLNKKNIKVILSSDIFYASLVNKLEDLYLTPQIINEMFLEI